MISRLNTREEAIRPHLYMLPIDHELTSLTHLLAACETQADETISRAHHKTRPRRPRKGGVEGRGRGIRNRAGKPNLPVTAVSIQSHPGISCKPPKRPCEEDEWWSWTGLPSHVKPSARPAYEASTTTPRVRDGGTLDGLGGAGNGKSWVLS